MNLEDLYLVLAVVLLGSIALGLFRIMRGPTPADAMLTVLLIGTTGTATVLLAGMAFGMARAVDIALVFALLAAILGVAFVLCGWPRETPSTEGD